MFVVRHLDDHPDENAKSEHDKKNGVNEVKNVVHLGLKMITIAINMTNKNMSIKHCPFQGDKA
jgi:hypothetical protein